MTDTWKNGNGWFTPTEGATEYGVKMTQAYVTALIDLGVDVGNDGELFELAERFDLSDVATETWARCERDVRDFLADNGDTLEATDYWGGWDGAVSAGYDFALTRNGHGVGFWDRGEGDIGEALTKSAKAYGEVDMYVGDDGKLYVL